MDAETRLCITRVRLLVLREIVRAGGRPRPGQVARALEFTLDLGTPWSSAGSSSHATVVNDDENAKRPRRKRSRVKRIYT